MGVLNNDQSDYIPLEVERQRPKTGGNHQ
jgi:hypothetical protein